MANRFHPKGHKKESANIKCHKCGATNPNKAFYCKCGNPLRSGWQVHY